MALPGDGLQQRHLPEDVPVGPGDRVPLEREEGDHASAGIQEEVLHAGGRAEVHLVCSAAERKLGAYVCVDDGGSILDCRTVVVVAVVLATGERKL